MDVIWVERVESTSTRIIQFTLTNTIQAYARMYLRIFLDYITKGRGIFTIFIYVHIVNVLKFYIYIYMHIVRIRVRVYNRYI